MLIATLDLVTMLATAAGLVFLLASWPRVPGTDGLVHISQLDTKRVAKVRDVIQEGEKIRVKVLEISRDGKIRLSHKAVLEESNEG